ncbi:MAG: class I SAM-dependent methyltransferase [Nitrospirae bacterium]|nr:class I SAM-dependent methyltransferase [Nitrospirota bacterium]
MTSDSGAQHSKEVQEGERFEFGKNWNKFLSVLNDKRIEEAERSLKEMLQVNDLKGRSFLDIGSGSGLFSLVARRLGARVHSFDYDPNSAACAVELRRRYFPDDSDWMIEQGSVLDKDYIKSLGEFDIVYSWGVLHHTGDMWNALDNARIPVRDGGLLFIAIYNDQGMKSDLWVKIKKAYCSGVIGKSAIVAVFIPIFILYGFIIDLIRMNNPIKRYSDYKNKRGMSIFYDWFDWLGGYPFEVASSGEIFDFYFKRGFNLIKLVTTNGLGTNEFVFRK